MTYSEQSKWLIDNGFNEIFSFIWEKELSGNKILQFNWHELVPDWQLIIFGDKDYKFDTEVWLIDSIPNDADFKQFQPLIDIIK